MAFTLSTGATVAVAKTYAAADTITAITNANPAVATTGAAHGIAVGDYVEISSGWGLLDKRVVRAGASTAGSTLELEGINTSDTGDYPAGEGIGSARQITVWTTLTQVKDVTASGGTQNFADITTLTDLTQRQMPTTRAPISMTVNVFDDPALPWYDEVLAADEARTPYGMLMTFANGSKLVSNAYWSLMRVPTIAKDAALETQISIAYAAEPVRYAT